MRTLNNLRHRLISDTRLDTHASEKQRYLTSRKAEIHKVQKRKETKLVEKAEIHNLWNSGPHARDKNPAAVAVYQSKYKPKHLVCTTSSRVRLFWTGPS